LAKSDSGIRKLISQNTWIRCLVDLSSISVFGSVDTYVVLLIFQKKINLTPAPSATIALCQELLGRALQDVIEGHETETQFYNIFTVNQNVFGTDEWILQPPSITSIEEKLDALPRMSDFMRVQVGVKTGNNKVFIISEREIPQGEEEIFIPFLSDREMESYTTPQKVKEYLFYPYFEGARIEESELKIKYPQTWNYLLQYKNKLESRASLKNRNKPWWDLDRARADDLIQPKIVSPHLAVMPRFSLDNDGKFAVVRSPIIFPKNRNIEHDLLRYFVAVLNSSICYRYITEHSHKYGSGYSMLEPKTLLKTPIPDPTKIQPYIMQQLLVLIDKRFLASGNEIIELEIEINKIVTDIYGLNEHERSIYGA
jgi:hypothetical protein